MSKIMKRIDKNSLEEVIIQLTNFRGKDLIDIRIWTKPLPTEEKESKPTKKGVCLSISAIPDLIEALKEAQRASEGLPGGEK